MNLERALLNSENEVVKLLINVIGTENTLALIKTAGGAPLYIPTIETISKEERNLNICNEFIQGATYKELSRKYGRTEKTIREVINSELKNNKRKGEKRVN